jgi:hypothetical protein
MPSRQTESGRLNDREAAEDFHSAGGNSKKNVVVRAGHFGNSSFIDYTS